MPFTNCIDYQVTDLAVEDRAKYLAGFSLDEIIRNDVPKFDLVQAPHYQVQAYGFCQVSQSVTRVVVHRDGRRQENGDIYPLVIVFWE